MTTRRPKTSLAVAVALALSHGSLAVADTLPTARLMQTCHEQRDDCATYISGYALGIQDTIVPTARGTLVQVHIPGQITGSMLTQQIVEEWDALAPATRTQAAVWPNTAYLSSFFVRHYGTEIHLNCARPERGLNPGEKQL